MSKIVCANLLAIVVACFVIGCQASSSNEQPLQSSASVPIATVDGTLTQATPTATLTLIPTNTPSPTPTYTPTSVPAVLEDLPTQLAENDVAIMADNFVFQITRIYDQNTIGSFTSVADKRYLVIEAYLYNYSKQDQVFYDSDFEASFDDRYGVLPNTELMRLLKDMSYPEINYPGRHLPLHVPMNVPASQSAKTFLVYEVPDSIATLALSFGPNGIQPRSRLGLWLIAEQNGEDYIVYKESVDNQQLYEVDWELTDARPDEPIDFQIFELDNCFGTGEMSKSAVLGQIVYAETNVGLDFNPANLSHTVLLTRVPVIRNLLEGLINVEFSREDGAVLNTELGDTVKAAPYTKSKYKIAWYKVFLTGNMKLSIGGVVHNIPFALSDRIRSEVESLPTDACPPTPVSP